MQDALFVDTPRQLEDAVAAMRRAPVLAFDTEFIGESTYEPQLCLLQVSDGDQIWILDPLAPLNLSGFWRVLTEPGREVVAVAARQELLFCLRFAGRPPGSVFDPQLIAGLVGLGYPLSHTNLVQRVLGVRVPGGETFTDWRHRPLSRAQLDYAASDVRHLIAMRKRLIAMAVELGREGWLQSESESLVGRVVESESQERWWRVSGATGLNRRGLAVLRDVWRWRDTEARGADLPPRRILGDELMVQIAKRAPKTTGDLFALRGFDRPALRRAGSDIVKAVQAALALPEEELPLLRRRDDAPQVPILSQLVSVVANSLAARYQVDPALLATSADLQNLVRWHLGAEEERPAILDGWRGEILGGPLLDLLTGKSHVRVLEAHSASPLVIEEHAG